MARFKPPHLCLASLASSHSLDSLAASFHLLTQVSRNALASTYSALDPTQLGLCHSSLPAGCSQRFESVKAWCSAILPTLLPTLFLCLLVRTQTCCCACVARASVCATTRRQKAACVGNPREITSVLCYKRAWALLYPSHIFLGAPTEIDAGA